MAAPGQLSDEDRVFAIGLRFVQQAIQFRVAGNEDESERYQNRFLDLLKTIEASDLHTAAHLDEDDTMAALNKVNEGRLALAAAESSFTGKIPPEYQAALKSSIESCQFLTRRLARGTPPPPIEERRCRVPVRVRNEELRANELLVHVHNIGCDTSVKNRQFSLRITGPRSGAESLPTEKFDGGTVDIDMKLKLPPNANNIGRKSVRFELVAHVKKLLKAIDVVVAHVEASLSPFASHCIVEKKYAMESTPDAPKDENFSISVTLKIRQSLTNPEWDDRELSYYVVKTPPPKRDVQSLNAEEKAEFMAALKAVRLMEDWELSKFLSLGILKEKLGFLNTALATFEKLNMEPMPKIVAQQDALTQKQRVLLSALKEKKIPLDDYKKRIAAVIEAETAEASEKGPDSKEGKILLERVKLLRDELATITGKSGS
jgi:hypothetical protein